jgi:small nuclear ribonucleoprotein G
MSSKGPNLKNYIDKTLQLSLNKNRKVTGTLRGYDNFMNIVLDDAVEIIPGKEGKRIGLIAIRGNSIVQLEQVS